MSVIGRCLMRDTELLQSAFGVGPTLDGGELSVRCRAATSEHRTGLPPGEPFCLSLLRAGGLSGSRHGAKELAASELFPARGPSRGPGAADPVSPIRVLQVVLPWARPGSGFTLLFEAFLRILAQALPAKRIADLIGEHDTRLWRIL